MIHLQVTVMTQTTVFDHPSNHVDNSKPTTSPYMWGFWPPPPPPLQVGLPDIGPALWESDPGGNNAQQENTCQRALHKSSAKCNHTCHDLHIFDLPVPCRCLAISLISPDKASKARFLLQVFCKPLKFVIFCKAVLVLDMDSVPLLLPALHCSCAAGCSLCVLTETVRIAR